MRYLADEIHLVTEAELQPSTQLHSYLKGGGRWAALHCTIACALLRLLMASLPSFVSSWCPGPSPFSLGGVSAGDGSFPRCYLGRPQPGLPERWANAFGYTSWKRIPKPPSSIGESDGRKVIPLPAAAAFGQTSLLLSIPWALCPFHR